MPAALPSPPRRRTQLVLSHVSSSNSTAVPPGYKPDVPRHDPDEAATPRGVKHASEPQGSRFLGGSLESVNLELSSDAAIARLPDHTPSQAGWSSKLPGPLSFVCLP